MDLITNTNIVLSVTEALTPTSDTFLTLIGQKDKVIKGFYLAFSEYDDTVVNNVTNIDDILENSFSTTWKEVTTTKTETGFELYLTNEDLPLDYSETEVGDKYKHLFIGYKNMLTGEIAPMLCCKLEPFSVVYDINTTIKFDANIECNFLYNHTEELSHLENLECNFDYFNDTNSYSILDMILKLKDYRDIGEVSGASFNNDVLKY